MSESHFLVRKVAVLGAGVMGAQIAAHLANASVPVLLFDLAAKDGDPNGIALKSLGAWRLNGLRGSVELLQVRAEDLLDDFPPPRPVALR